MPFVLKNDALGANVDGAVLAEELGALVRMLETVFLGGLGLRLQLLLLELV